MAVTVTKMEKNTPIKKVKFYMWFEALVRSTVEGDEYNIDFDESSYETEKLKEKIVELIQNNLSSDLTYNSIEFDIYFDEDGDDLRLSGSLNLELPDTTYGYLETLEGDFRGITDEDIANAINEVKNGTTEELYVSHDVETTYKVDHDKMVEPKVETEEEKPTVEDAVDVRSLLNKVLGLNVGESFTLNFSDEDIEGVARQRFAELLKEDPETLRENAISAYEDKVSKASCVVADVPSELFIKRIDEGNLANSFDFIQTWTEATVDYTFNPERIANEEDYEYSNASLDERITYEVKYNGEEFFGDEELTEQNLKEFAEPTSELWKVI